jgi:catechol 2,3-dioxygenase-like lactoylglutathione lyase family enzyme
MSDKGLTHIALPVSDLEKSLEFYAKYANMQVVHSRESENSGTRVAWISDRTRPFVIVLIEMGEVKYPLRPAAHLGVGCASREEVDRLVAEARGEGRPVFGPTDSPYPVGYWALISDPDDHTLEVSYGQEVALTVREARDAEDAS